MTTPPPPSPEESALAFVLAKALPRIMTTDPDGARTFDVPELARRLHEAGWRRESDVYRAAAEHLVTWTVSPAVIGTVPDAWPPDDDPNFRRGVEHVAAVLGRVADMFEHRDKPGKPMSRDAALARLNRGWLKGHDDA